MSREIILDEGVEKDIEAVKKLISEQLVDGKNLYSAAVDLLADGTRSTTQQLDYMAVYEQAVSVFRESSIGLRRAMDTQTIRERIGVLEQMLGPASAIRVAPVKTSPGSVDIGEKKNQRELLAEQLVSATIFSNSYALYFAGQVGLALLDSQKREKLMDRYFFGKGEQALEDLKKLSSGLARTTTIELMAGVTRRREAGKQIDDGALKDSLERTFTSWINQFQWSSFADVAKTQNVEGTALKYGNFSMCDGVFGKKYDNVVIEGSFMKVTVDDLIGQEADREVMIQNVYRLLSWDEEKKRNPFASPTGVIVFGGPGCGKTMSGHAYVNLAVSESRKLKIPFLALQLNIGAFGSSYQNEPALKLTAIRERVRTFPGAVMMQGSDVDTFLPQKRSREPSQEENKVNGVCFSLLDNSIIPAGKFMALFDANYLDNLDPALMSRFGQRIELKRFEKPEDFARYAKIYLTKDSDGVGITTDAQWLSIGQYLLESGLSNREIANVINNLKGNFKITPEIVLGSYEDKVAFRNDYLRTIDADMLLGKFQDFIDTTMTMERKSREAKLRDLRRGFEESLGSGKVDIGQGSGVK